MTARQSSSSRPKPPGAGFNRHGGLTLVPLPRFGERARAIALALTNNKEIPTDIAVPEFGERASGEPFVRLGKDHVGGHDCVVLASGPLTWELLGQLQMVLYYLSGRRAERIAVILMYLPWSRSEKPEGNRELALTPALIQFLESATGPKGVPLDRIIAADLHSPAIGGLGMKPGLITEVSFTRRVLQQAVSDARAQFGNGKPRICILYSDASAQTWY